VDLDHDPVHPSARAERASVAEASERITFRPKCPARAPSVVPARRLSSAHARSPAIVTIETAAVRAEKAHGERSQRHRERRQARDLESGQAHGSRRPVRARHQSPAAELERGAFEQGPISVAAVSAKAAASEAT